MNQLDLTQATTTKGQPLLAGSLKWIQDSVIDAFKMLTEGVLSEEVQNLSTTTGVALWGCTQSGNIIASGYVYYLGELYRFDGDDITAYVNDPVCEIVTTNGGLDPITFSDGTTGSVHNIRRIRVIDGVLGSADFDYVDIAFLNSYRILTKVVDIGIWNMDSTATMNVAHLMDSTRIRSVEVWIKHDTTGEVFPLTYNTAGTPAGYFTYDGTNIIMARLGGGLFDGTDFDSVASSRGYIVITWQ